MVGREHCAESGFEEVAADGRTPQYWMNNSTPPDSGAAVDTDTTIFLQGQRSLRIAVAKPGTTAGASSWLIPVEGGADLFSCAYRGTPDYSKVTWLGANRTSELGFFYFSLSTASIGFKRQVETGAA